ncbi:MAG: membrane protein insertase YidC [Pseudomonadota bacterium]
MLGGNNKEETRNLILAAVLSMAVVFTWYALFPPEPPAPPAEYTADGQPIQGADGTVQGTGQGTGQGAPGAAGGPVVPLDRDGALVRTDRVPVVSEAVVGSISLTGGRLDDLHLEEYRDTLDPESDTVVLLNPTGGPAPYYAVWGWQRTAGGDPGPLPTPNTDWTLEDGRELTPDSPVTLAWDNGEGLVFRRTYAVDERYMFTVTQSVENTTGEAISLAPYGYLARRGTPDTIGFFILHEGVVATIDGELTELSYSSLEDLPANALEGGRATAVPVQTNGWLGFTDRYWMTTLIPGPGTPFDAVYKSIGGPGTGQQIEYRTEMRLPLQTIEPGTTAEVETRLFAGAKELRTVQGYQDDLGIDKFEDAIDWGWFWFLTKPVANLLVWIQGLIGNMGFSILALTFLVKLVLFPLAYKSYVAMGRMKKLQPEMEKIKERAGDDRTKLQQEMMELYKKEKVNPAAGCLPILVQIPIFFSLYKVLFVTIDMRHAPFVLWINDLSAPDPTSWMNLFGALPFDAPDPGIGLLGLFSIGVLPVIMGITMWMQQKLNPAPTDPTQAMIFAWMPWVFMFMLGTFASGLVIYWIANNILTFTQQYAIMRSQGVEVDFFGNVTRSLRRKKADEAKAANDPAPAKAKPDPKPDDTPDDAPSDDGSAAASEGDGRDGDDAGPANDGAPLREVPQPNRPQPNRPRKGQAKRGRRRR